MYAMKENKLLGNFVCHTFIWRAAFCDMRWMSHEVMTFNVIINIQQNAVKKLFVRKHNKCFPVTLVFSKFIYCLSTTLFNNNSFRGSRRHLLYCPYSKCLQKRYGLRIYRIKLFLKEVSEYNSIISAIF